jgi:hypothetical protein
MAEEVMKFSACIPGVKSWEFGSGCGWKALREFYERRDTVFREIQEVLGDRLRKQFDEGDIPLTQWRMNGLRSWERSFGGMYLLRSQLEETVDETFGIRARQEFLQHCGIGLRGDVGKDAEAFPLCTANASDQAQQSSDMRFKRFRHPEINAT